ncbi:hypothetical protein [Myceligenerans salitolerans]|uniref:Gram-positive cocci surface proteins LPxTG domain-containing protein n=1 Tax=Myceligenerans salitolerans TaxID=1230528 RepID=A0ABS3IEV3_9MICO|nr:hypothetical protein [Myceligenerans salitolerans]MBO0611176.1 hypothetical protein [Myceligenerans salitolerans]
MNRIAALGATALLAVGLGAAPAVAAPLTYENGFTVTASNDSGATCPKDGKIDVGDDYEGDPKEITITAPEGQVITGYCVKAGSAKQGEGPEYVEFGEDDYRTEVTIKHSSGKDISHYTVFYADAPSPSPSPSDEPSDEPSDGSSEEPGDEPTTGPSEEPTTGPSDEPTEPGTEPSDEAEDDGGVLAATGAGPAIGYGLLALALVGGGAALLVLRRRRMA